MPLNWPPRLFCLLIRAVTCHLPVVFVLNSPVMYFVPGFEITIDHPHTDVVKCSQLVRGRGFLLCSLCPLLFFVPPPVRVGRGVKTMCGLMVTWTHLALLLTFWDVCVLFFPLFFCERFCLTITPELNIIKYCGWNLIEEPSVFLSWHRCVFIKKENNQAYKCVFDCYSICRLIPISLFSFPLFSLPYSKQGSGTDFLFHGYQQVVILPLLCCTLTAHHSFL